MDRYQTLRRAHPLRGLFTTGMFALVFLARGWAAPCWAEERPVIENSIGMKLVSIPAGEFLMGGTEKELIPWEEYRKAHSKMAMEKAEGDSKAQEIPETSEVQLELCRSERPQHQVQISKPFFLGKYPVTQQEFAKIMGFNPSNFSSNSKTRTEPKAITSSVAERQTKIA